MLLPCNDVFPVLRLEPGGVSIMSACAVSSVETGGGVLVRREIFYPLVVGGAPLNGLETFVDFVSGLEVDSLVGNGHYQCWLHRRFTFICFVNP